MRSGDAVERGLSGRVRARRFAAIASPHAVHVIEYGRQRQELEILGGVRQALEGTEPEELARTLAAAVESLGGRGGELDLGINGFGSAHHILMLPPAEDDVLRLIVRRELLRYYPDLQEPLIDFVPGSEVTGAEGPRRELLVGAVPSRLAERLVAGLRERGIVLRHLTVLPQVMQRVYDAFDGSAPPAVAVLLLQTGPLIGCFHQAHLRLFIEPPHDVRGRPVKEPAAVVEQVERASLFLRQQFPGTSVDRVLLAAEPADFAPVQAALAERLGSTVTRLADAAPGSIAALGSALDAESPDSLQLLPVHLRPIGSTERWTRSLAAAAAVVIALAATWWAGSAIRVARAEAAEAERIEGRIADRLPWLAQAQDVVTQRRAHEQRLAFLTQTAATRDEVRRMLAGVALAAGPSIRLESLQIEQVDEGWRLALAGVAGGASGAAAFRVVDGLYRGIPERLPVTQHETGPMIGRPDDPDFPVAIEFDMSFIVSWERDLQR